MNTRRTRRHLAGWTVAIAALAIFPAACGSDSGGDADDPDQTEVVDTTSAPDDTTEVNDTTETPAETTGSSDAGSGSDEDWDAVVEAAKQEGRVVFYTSQTDQIIASIEEAFEAEYPEIDFVGLRTLGGELVTRVEQERTSNAEGADVIVGSDPAFMASVDETGGLVPLVGPALDDRADLFVEYPLLHPSDNRVIFSAEGYWIVWNTDRVTEPIEDYPDFLARADEFRGAFGIPELFSPSVPIFYTHVAEGVDGIDLPEQFANGGIEGSDYLEAIADLEPRFYESAVPLTQAVAAGEIVAGMFSIASTIATLQSEGAPIEATLSVIAPTAASMTTGVTEWAGNPNAGQVLVNFLLSDAGQQAVNSHNNLGLDDGIEGGAGGVELMALPRAEVLDPEYSAAFVDYWNQTFGR